MIPLIMRRLRLFSTVAKAEKTEFVKGKVLSNTKLDLGSVYAGQKLKIPYEVTVDSGWRDQWQAQFYQQDRLYTSHSFAQAFGFEQAPLPNCLVMFLALSMSHVDQTRDVFDLRIQHAVYEKPVYPLDTLIRRFTIHEVRESRDGKRVIVDVLCEVFNQHEERCYSLVKTMMFMKTSLGHSVTTLPMEWSAPVSYFGNLVCNRARKSSVDAIARAASFYSLEAGQLIMHSFQRPCGLSAMNLSTQFRMTHPRLFNTSRFKPHELIVATPIILAATHASASHELFETYYESVDDAVFPNPCGPEDNIGAMTFVKSVQSKVNHLEEVKCVTIGMKNIDVTRSLSKNELPLSLFENEKSFTTKEIEDICDENVPLLSRKIVAHSQRTLIREKPVDKDDEFFLL